jgi:hypothetical protein
LELSFFQDKPYDTPALTAVEGHDDMEEWAMLLQAREEVNIVKLNPAGKLPM